MTKEEWISEAKEFAKSKGWQLDLSVEDKFINYYYPGWIPEIAVRYDSETDNFFVKEDLL